MKTAKTLYVFLFWIFLLPVHESIYIEYCNLIVSYLDILPLSDLARPILSHLPVL